ncbi:MAG TPA: hypothetical protein VHU80_08375 [Polyangiaceae bacterium]|jgi:hypothetical protein|nr:hypothetical protein [Polyangiaceae bacterium]
MTDVLLPATSGRAKCRGCGHAIRTGELRFGEALPNPYGEGEALYWFHPTCAACMRPEKFAPALAASEVTLEEREWLRAACEKGSAFPRLARLAYAERSKSGKAHCRSCRETIPGGVMRLALVMFEEGRMNPIGFIHVECANAYFGRTDILDRVERLSTGLDGSALAEVAERLKHPREAVKEDDAPPPTSLHDGPELVKTQPVLETDAERTSLPSTKSG